MFSEARLCLACLAVGALAGCRSPLDTQSMGGVYEVTPSYALSDSFGPPSPPGLHGPYAVGSQFMIAVPSDVPPSGGWTFTSSDPGVLRLQATQDILYYDATAVAAGHTTLALRDASGNVVTQQDVQVASPDGVQLWAPGPLATGLTQAQTPITAANVLSNGGATFLVRYFLGSQELAGNGGAVTSAGSVTASMAPIQSLPSWGGDGVFVVGAASPGAPGALTVSIGTTAAVTVPIQTVDASDIASLTVFGQSESGAVDGQYLSVLVRALDAQGADIFGGRYTWQGETDAGALASPPEGYGPSETDSYLYAHDGSETLNATLLDAPGSASASLTVHGTLPTQQLPDDCSVAHPGARPPWSVSLWAIGAALALRRVRRSRR